MAISAETYERVALEDVDGQWELDCGALRRKPGMTAAHNEVQSRLHIALGTQLDRRRFTVRSNSARLRLPSGAYYIPDVCVIPLALAVAARAQPLRLEAYAEPVPLVVEVWSPSTGEYDVEVKLEGYKQRGDLEIWRLHPYERTLTAWRRQPDGSYSETLFREGIVEPVALPGVRIDLAELFA